MWKKDEKEILTSHKYGINIYDDDRYQKTLSLRIGKLSDDDFGKYICYAKNILGNDEEATILAGIVALKQYLTWSSRSFENHLALQVRVPESDI